MLPSALIIDLDGTLADTERDGHRVAFNRAFAEAGLDWVWDAPLYGELLAVAGGKERMRHYVECYRPDYRPSPDSGRLIDLLHAAKTRHYGALVAAGAIPLRPGVRTFLEEARRASVRLAIATTTTRDNVDALLSHALASDAVGWFHVIAAGDGVAAKKPAPDVYYWVLKRLGLSGSECVAFEDSGMGLRSALAAGVPTVVTVNDYTRDQDFRGAALVVEDLSRVRLAELEDLAIG